MSKIEIDFAKADDLNEILVIKKQSHSYFANKLPQIYKESNILYTDDFLTKFFNEKDKKILISRWNEKIIGYAFIELMSVKLPMMTTRKYIYIHDIAVDERYRNNGAASELLYYTEEYAKEYGADKIELAVHLFNENALSLYENNGFRARTVRMEKLI